MLIEKGLSTVLKSALIDNNENANDILVTIKEAKIKEFEPFFEVLNADTTYDEKKYNISKKYYEQDIDTCVQFLKSAPHINRHKMLY